MTLLRRPDPCTVALAGLTTWAWYAVPDVVGSRPGRAVAKTMVAVVGAALAVGVTREGREARAAVARALGTAPAEAVPGEDPSLDDAPRDAEPLDANPSLLGTTDDIGEEVVLRTPVLVGATVAGVVIAGSLTVAGERWVYRRGEALRERGWPAPHTTVGAAMGLLAAGLAAVDVQPDDEDVSPSS